MRTTMRIARGYLSGVRCGLGPERIHEPPHEKTSSLFLIWMNHIFGNHETNSISLRLPSLTLTPQLIGRQLKCVHHRKIRPCLEPDICLCIGHHQGSPTYLAKYVVALFCPLLFNFFVVNPSFRIRGISLA
jgi:hypothetical protein